MSGVNRVIMVGNLGKDPEVKQLENGSKIANFNLATTEYYTDGRGEKKKETNWHKMVAWSEIAENIGKILKKGDEIYLEGKLKTREYISHGEKKFITEVVISTFRKL